MLVVPDSALSRWAELDAEGAAMQSAMRIDVTDPIEAEAWHEDAFRFLVDALGRGWLEREIHPRGRGGYLLLDGPEDNGDGVLPHVRTDRLLTLALELQEAQAVAGFGHLVRDIRTRSLYEAVAEMRAANHMMRAGQTACFVDPNAADGRSFDAVIVLSGLEVAVEVKAKLPQPVDHYRPRLIENALNAARKQLPPAGPSLIYLQLASPWTDDPDVMRSVDQSVRRWLSKTRRVNGVHLMVERTFVHPNGHAAISRGICFIPNLSVHVPVPDIQDWLDTP